MCKYSKEVLLEAATAVHKWLTTEKCAFRAILRILSAGAVFYQAQMSDKTARAWLHPEGGKADLAHFQDAVLARHKPKEWAEARGLSSSSGFTATRGDKPSGLFE